MTDKKTFEHLRGEVAGTVATLALLSIGIPTVATLGNGPTFFVAHSAPSWLVSLIIGALVLIPIVLLLVPVVLGWFVRNGKLRLAIAQNFMLAGLTIGFFVLFYTFPSGMVLYWTAANELHLLHAFFVKTS